MSSITMGFREALLEDMQSKKEETITWKVKAKRGNFDKVIVVFKVDLILQSNQVTWNHVKNREKIKRWNSQFYFKVRTEFAFKVHFISCPIPIVIFFPGLASFCVLLLLGLSAAAVIFVVKRSESTKEGILWKYDHKL